jgi:hypothetical protein
MYVRWVVRKHKNAATADERALVVDLLREKVPALTEGEVREAFRNNIRWYSRWCRDRGSALSRDDLLRLIEGADDGMSPV